jgi:FlaG/FlaF family flagellin (archaellin)
MRFKFSSLLTVLGAVAVLVLTANTVSMAATGHALLLGRTNTTSKATAVKRTAGGPALTVVTKYASNPPFAVNGTGRVTRLNADRVDGYDSLQMLNRSYLYTGAINTPTTGYTRTIPVAAGTYAYSFNAFLFGGSGSGTYCKLVGHHGTGSTNIGVVTASTVDPGLSSSGILKVAAGDTLELVCGGSTTSFVTQSGSPVQIVLTPVASLGGAALPTS